MGEAAPTAPRLLAAKSDPGGVLQVREHVFYMVMSGVDRLVPRWCIEHASFSAGVNAALRLLSNGSAVGTLAGSALWGEIGSQFAET